MTKMTNVYVPYFIIITNLQYNIENIKIKKKKLFHCVKAFIAIYSW